MFLKPFLRMGLLVALIAGCAADKQEKSSSFLGKLSSSAGFGGDGIQLEIAHLRQPVGNPFINHELWNAVDEQILPIEQRPIVEANGYRLGTISGSPPQALQDLITSHRSCLKARRMALRAGHTVFFPLGENERTCAIRVHDGAKIQLVEATDPPEANFERAQMGLALQANFADDGRIRLKMEPRVQHGDYQLLPRPAQEEGNWSLLPGRREEKYTQVGWELSLAPNEYLIIGGQTDHPQTLGHYGFVQTDLDRTKQDLLVIRFVGQTATTAKPSSQGDRSAKDIEPLALQSVTPTH